MKIKEISIKNGDYFIRDVKKEYENSLTAKIYFTTYEKYKLSILEYYNRNKKENLVDFVILEND